jgi:hypothetical protein
VASASSPARSAAAAGSGGRWPAAQSPLARPTGPSAGQLLALQRGVQAGAGQVGGGLLLYAQLLAWSILLKLPTCHAPGQLATGGSGFVHGSRWRPVLLAATARSQARRVGSSSTCWAAVSVACSICQPCQRLRQGRVIS